jgi:hypothetical protein
MPWSEQRNFTVGPADVSPISVGDFSIEEGDDTIWVKMTSAATQGECAWPWSYGLLTWITDEGRELGTVKVNGVCEGEVFKLGNGLPPQLRAGRVEFTPRSYNLQWIKLGHPWQLSFQFQSGKLQSAGPELVGGSTLFVPTVPELPEGNAQPDFSIEDAFAFLLFNWFLK